MSTSARLVASVLGAVLLGGCGSASAPSPPTGVDELVIPRPSLGAADFVDEIDNPWLPLAPGSEWVYRRSEDGKPSLVTVSVLDDHREIQGVTATVVRTAVTDPQRGAVEESVAWFAQDEDGNVWSLGEDGVWVAGADGAEAGLAMPARPRVGDGYRTEYLAGVAEASARVVSLDGSASVPYGDLTDLLETEVTDPLQPGVVERRLYARDIGLVRAVALDGDDRSVDLVELTRP